MHLGGRGIKSGGEGPASPAGPKKQGLCACSSPKAEPSLGSMWFVMLREQTVNREEISDTDVHSTARTFFVVRKENVIIMIFKKK